MVRHIRAWRVFRRMQWTALAYGLLLYAAVGLEGWRRLAYPGEQKQLIIVLFPALFAGVCALAPLTIPPLRRVLMRYVWLSFAAGFGQTVVSVVTSLGVLSLAAGLIWWQIDGVAAGGRPPSGIFSAYGAGLGILLAQAVLCLQLEKEPQVRAVIEERR